MTTHACALLCVVAVCCLALVTESSAASAHNHGKLEVVRRAEISAIKASALLASADLEDSDDDDEDSEDAAVSALKSQERDRKRRKQRVLNLGFAPKITTPTPTPVPQLPAPAAPSWANQALSVSGFMSYGTSCGGMIPRIPLPVFGVVQTTTVDGVLQMSSLIGKVTCGAFDFSTDPTADTKDNYNVLAYVTDASTLPKIAANLPTFVKDHPNLSATVLLPWTIPCFPELPENLNKVLVLTYDYTLTAWRRLYPVADCPGE